MIIIATRNLEVDNSPPPHPQDLIKRKRIEPDESDHSTQDFKAPFHLPAKKLATENETQTHSPQPTPPSHLLQDCSHSPLNQLPLPWKQFLHSFLNNRSMNQVSN